MSGSTAGIVNIHGKEYQTVAYRVSRFREEHKDWAIVTELVSAQDAVVMKAIIKNPDGQEIATGYAEEVRGSTNINKTSALENAETSAIGRALAAFGIGGTEYATADEVANAINQQTEKALYAKFCTTMNAVLDNIPTIHAIQECIANEDISTAAEAWFELDDETKAALWVAPSKGGPFTTSERKIIASSEFRKSYYGEENE